MYNIVCRLVKTKGKVCVLNDSIFGEFELALDSIIVLFFMDILSVIRFDVQYCVCLVIGL